MYKMIHFAVHLKLTQYCNQLLFSHLVTSDPLWPDGLQHTRLLWPSLSLGDCSNSHTLSRWCHPTISFSLVPFSPCPQSFPASGSFPISQLFTSGGQSIGRFSFNISPSNAYSGLISIRADWFDLLAVQGTLKSLPQLHSTKASILQHSAFFMVQLSHPYMTCLSFYSFPYKEQVSFNFTAAVTICSNFGARENKICHCFHFFPIYLPWSDAMKGADAMILVFWILSLSKLFHSPLSPSSRGSLVTLYLLP